MSERTKTVDLLRSQYFGKSPAKLLKDFPNHSVRILFPKMPYTQDSCKDRINVVVIDGAITKIWLG